MISSGRGKFRGNFGDKVSNPLWFHYGGKKWRDAAVEIQEVASVK